MRKIPFTKKHSIALGILTVLVLVIWIIPIRMTTAYMVFETPSLADGVATSVTVTSEEAYDPNYTVMAVVQDGALRVKLEREYLSVDRVRIHEAHVANAVVRMDVCGSVTDLADYVAASLDSGIVTQADDGTSILSDASLDTIRRGIHHPTLLRVYMTFLLLFAAVTAAVYRFVKKRLGTIKALTVIGIPVGSLVMLAVAEGKRYLDNDIVVRGYPLANWIPVLVIVLLLCGILLTVYLCPKNKAVTAYVVIGIYVLAFVFAGAKIMFYEKYVAYTPDETAHIGYVAHLTKTGEWIPQFENIERTQLLENDNNTMHMAYISDSMTYLKHPPTFYHIARLANAVTFLEDGTFTVDVHALRMVSVVMVMTALALIFYVGYTRFKNASPLVHLVYAAVCVCIPMLTYCASGFNNDSMTLLTVTIFFFGLLRFVEKKRNIGTYLLIFGGISLTAITKFTAALVVVIAALIVLIVTLFKEKNIKQLLKPAFLIPLVLLGLPIAYYAYMFVHYGSFQPNMFELNPEYAKTTEFYVDVAARNSKSLLQYMSFFLTNFMKTWTGVVSHVALPKTDASWLSEQNVALVAVWLIPFLFAKKSLRRQSPYSTVVIAGCAGVFAAVVVQLINGFDVFTSRGYPGGVQSRYYLCAIMFFAFGLALAVQKTTQALENKGRHAGILCRLIESCAVVFVGMLFYEDILYFLMHFTEYIQ